VLLAVAGCKSRKDDSQKSDSQAEAMLAGYWLDEENESVAFMAKGDTLYYPDADILPVHFRIYGDSLYMDGNSPTRYFIERITPNLFVFRNQNGERVRLVKTSDPLYKSVFRKESKPINEVNQQLLKRDTVVTGGDTRYHCYIQINPTTYRVVKNGVNDEGVGVGKVYYDNFVNVTVYIGSRRVYSHDFRKQEFTRFVPNEIMRQSILSDIVYVSCTADGVNFQAQLKIPESASSYIVNIEITSDGRVHLSQP